MLPFPSLFHWYELSFFFNFFYEFGELHKCQFKKWSSVKISFTPDTYPRIKILKKNSRQTILTGWCLNIIYMKLLSNISADSKYKCLSSIYSPTQSKNHLVVEQQNKLLILAVRVISESKRVIFEPKWISEDNQT